MHVECETMGEPVDTLTLPLWPIPNVRWRRWLWQANDEEEMFRSVEDDL